MTPWEQFQLSHPTAVRLCECANGLVRANQPLDTLHLMYAALSPQAPDVQVSAVIAQLLPQTLRERWVVAIVAELLQPAPAAAPHQPSLALAQCVELWRQRAADPTLPVTDVFMIATIIGVDVRVQRMMDLCGIAPQTFVQNLWQLSAQVTVQRFSQ